MTTQKSRTRTWVIALVSIAALAVFGTVVLIGLGVYVFMSNVDIEDATPETAALSRGVAGKRAVAIHRGTPRRAARRACRSPLPTDPPP